MQNKPLQYDQLYELEHQLAHQEYMLGSQLEVYFLKQSKQSNHSLNTDMYTCDASRFFHIHGVELGFPLSECWDDQLCLL